MNKNELFKMALTNLFRRKTRSILSILGVLIGTCSIITMISIGLGMSKNFEEQMAKNSNLHEIEIYGKVRDINDFSNGSLDEKEVTKIKRIKGVTNVTGVKSSQIRLIIGDYTTFTTILGLDADFLNKAKFNVKEGRNLKKSDKNKILIGEEIPGGFQNYKSGNYIPYSPSGDYGINLISNKVELTNNEEYKVPRKNNSFNSSFSTTEENENKKIDYEVFKYESVGVVGGNGPEPYNIYTTMENIDNIIKSDEKARKSAGSNFGDSRNRSSYDKILVYVKNVDDVSKVIEKLKEEKYEFYSIMSYIKQAKKEFAAIQAVLAAIGGISLFVAAIGITNTMIMSIYERTREIGVMKVIGANLSDIKNLFLSEAALIGLIGGVLGSILSCIIAYVINNFLGNMFFSMMGMYNDPEMQTRLSYIPLWLILIGVGFSTIIGIVSGYFPARKAMKLSALESLRNE